MPLNILFAGALIDALYGSRTKEFYYIATGKTLDRLKTAYTGFMHQEKILADLKDHFGAERVNVSAREELNVGWPEMKAALGFKLYFKQDQHPEGWFIPERWKDHQSDNGNRVYLPPEGSADQAVLAAARQQLREVHQLYYAGFENTLIPVPTYCKIDFDKTARDEHPTYYQMLATEADFSMGWHNWMVNALPHEDWYRPYAQSITPETFIITVREGESKDRPSRIPEDGFPIDEKYGRLMIADPSVADKISDRLQHPKGMFHEVLQSLHLKR